MYLSTRVLGKFFLHDAVEAVSELIETFTIYGTLSKGVHTINPHT